MIRLSNISICLLFLFMFWQCSSKSIKGQSDNTILLTLNQGERFSEKTKETIDILTRRLITIGVEKPVVIFDEHFIQVEIPNETDLDKFADLLCPTGKFEIYELYPALDLLHYFKTLSTEIESGKYVDNDISLKDKLAGKTLLELLNLSPEPNNINELTNGPLTTATRDAKQKIQYALDRTSNHILLKEDFPGIEFRWMGNFEKKGVQALYAINKSVSHIDNNNITHTQSSTDKTKKQSIHLGFDARGTRNLAQMTIPEGKSAVISLDNIIHFSQIFNKPITSGIIFIPFDFKKNSLISEIILQSGAFHKSLLIEDYKIIQNGKLIKQSAVLSPDEIQAFEILRKKIQQHNDKIFTTIDKTSLDEIAKNFLKTKIFQVSNQHIYNTIAERRLSQIELEQMISDLKKIEAQLEHTDKLKKLLPYIRM